MSGQKSAKRIEELKNVTSRKIERRDTLTSDSGSIRSHSNHSRCEHREALTLCPKSFQGKVPRLLAVPDKGRRGEESHAAKELNANMQLCDEETLKLALLRLEHTLNVTKYSTDKLTGHKNLNILKRAAS
jgi:hypothetical protein